MVARGVNGSGETSCKKVIIAIFKTGLKKPVSESVVSGGYHEIQRIIDG